MNLNFTSIIIFYKSIQRRINPTIDHLIYLDKKINKKHK